jgi:thiol-disulfide isomerase/thioredoxin
MLLAGSVIVNTLAVPLLLLPQPAAASAAVLQAAETPGAAQRALLAPPVQAEADEQQQQQQWWQQDQQVWQELTSPSELTAYLNSSQPPPAWPAVDSTALAPKLRLVEFYATWCPACKAAAPGMAEVAGVLALRVVFTVGNCQLCSPQSQALSVLYN